MIIKARLLFNFLTNLVKIHLTSTAVKINNSETKCSEGNKCKHQGSQGVKSIIKLMKNLSAIIAPRFCDSFPRFRQIFASKQIFLCQSINLLIFRLSFGTRNGKITNGKIDEFFGVYVSPHANIRTEC